MLPDVGSSRGHHFTLALLGCLAALTGPAEPLEAAEPEIASVGLVAQFPDKGDYVDVRVRYRLRADSVTHAIPLRVLSFFGAEPTDIRAAVGGRQIEVRLDHSRAPLLTGTISLPQALGTGEEIDLELRYRVRGAVRGGSDDWDAAVPVLLVEGRPGGSSEDFFTAVARLPPDRVVVESFPTVPRRMEETDAGRHYSLTLQVVPAMVRWRGGVGEPPLFSFERTVDILILGLLLVLSLIAYRTLRDG